MINDIRNHREYVHTDQSRTFTKIADTFCGRQNYEFFDICHRYLSHWNYKNIFEVGCAPGNFLIYFFKKYGLIPDGIDYAISWVKKTQENFATQHIPGTIWQQDFFDDSFIKAHEEAYDVVFSLWFIEHYDNPADAIQRHFSLTKPWGLVIITIPNLHGLNKICVPNDILAIHNRKIMNEDALRELFTSHTILHLERMWWPLNIWLFFYKNKVMEWIRLVLFAIQRLLIDPLLILLYRLGIKYNRTSSPQWIIICKKD